mmetsp:Transcript_16922/g.42731  ORF Transcript_16922/g.42731 Transcript_16922/m.42731 type:complete len:101 (-) Transcript_16922:23-325(-)
MGPVAQSDGELVMDNPHFVAATSSTSSHSSSRDVASAAPSASELRSDGTAGSMPQNLTLDLTRPEASPFGGVASRLERIPMSDQTPHASQSRFRRSSYFP